MSNQLEKIKELIERRAVARIGGGCSCFCKGGNRNRRDARTDRVKGSGTERRFESAFEGLDFRFRL